ncbi:MAG: polysaccharide deacetylase family protein [Lentisphaeraceae bacterium]|nr:polysaccharide deacetylase family protein [Lentisphaeraceae bacterium]
MKKCIILILLLAASCRSTEPQKTVVLTFDDSVKSQALFVAPLLIKHGFNATFFITEGFSFKSRKDLYMSWDEIKKLHAQGFEIGNHTKRHKSVKALSEKQLHESLQFIEKKCEKFAIPKPISFCYPGYKTAPKALKVLKERGYKFARAGGKIVSEIGKDNLLLLPQAFDGKPKSTFAQFKAAVDQADEKHIPILTFHGVPDIEHPWVNTDQEKFMKYMNYLKENNFKVIALRDYPERQR